MKIKVLISLILGAALSVCPITTAIAATDDDVVTITVQYVDLLEVPITAALTLTTTTPGATAYDEGTLTQAAGLKYSHNSTSSKKITATAVQDAGDGNDVTLTAAIADGEDPAAVVSGGVVQSDVLLWTGITADGYTKNLSWTANGTLAGTKAGANINKDYVWTVTFTSTDAS